MTVIEAKREFFRIDYTNEVLPALFQKQDSDSDFSENLLRIDYDEIIKEVDKASLTLLIATDQIRNQELIQTLQTKADGGVRIYLLLGNAKNNQTAIDALSGRCLIRTGVSQKGALIAADHSTSKALGLLVMNHEVFTVPDQQSWAIQLELLQIDDSFRSFCKLFWEHSQNEYLLQNQSKEKAKHPDGNVVTNHSHQLCGTLKGCLGETLANLQGASHSAFEANDSKYALLLNSDSQNIQARQGVVLTDSSVPSLLLSEQGNWLVPDATDFNTANWCLRLSDRQSQQLASAYNQAIEEAAWQYQAEVKLGELADQQYIRFSDQPDLIRHVESLRKMELEPISTQTIDSFLEGRAEELANPQIGWQRDFLAHQIDYQLVIHPPYCPESARKDSLYEAWKQSEQTWQDQLSSLEGQQGIIDEQQADIAERLKGFLKGFLLGQGQSAKRLSQEIAELKGCSVTKATPAEREQQRKRLDDLQSRVMQRGSETTVELDKAEQNRRWEENREELEKALKEKNDIAKSKALSCQKIQDNAPEKRQKAKGEFLNAWQKAVAELTDIQLETTTCNGIKPERFSPKNIQDAPLIETAKAESIRKKREELENMSFKQAEQWKSTFKDKIWKKHYSAFNKALENSRLSLQKIDRGIQEAVTAESNSQSELQRAQSNLDAHGEQFVYQPKKESKALDHQLGLKNKAHKPESFKWPDEDLPNEGTELRSQGKQRYLVISYMDQLGPARKDAERLNAAIVCDRENIINA